MLLSKSPERDFEGNNVPRTMIAAEEKLERLSRTTLKEAELWDWQDG